MTASTWYADRRANPVGVLLRLLALAGAAAAAYLLFSMLDGAAQAAPPGPSSPFSLVGDAIATGTGTASQMTKALPLPVSVPAVTRAPAAPSSGRRPAVLESRPALLAVTTAVSDELRSTSARLLDVPVLPDLAGLLPGSGDPGTADPPGGPAAPALPGAGGTPGAVPGAPTVSGTAVAPPAGASVPGPRRCPAPRCPAASRAAGDPDEPAPASLPAHRSGTGPYTGNGPGNGPPGPGGPGTAVAERCCWQPVLAVDRARLPTDANADSQAIEIAPLPG